MKKIIFLLASFVTFYGFSQSEGFNYKFLVTDNGNAVTSPVNVKISIKENGSLIWQEEHTGVQPDDNGIAVVYVGEGTQTGGSATSFDAIDWSSPKTYDVEIDTGNGYSQMVSDAPFKFVPKAKFAESADYNHLTNKPRLFYISGTQQELAVTNDQPIFHEGRLVLGQDTTLDAQLYIYQKYYTPVIFSDLNVGDNNAKTGIYSYVSGSGNGYLKGFASLITSSGTGTQVNVWNENNSDNSGTHVGVYNRMKGTGTGFQVGVMNEFFNSQDNYQYGIYNVLNNDGNGPHFGMVNMLQGSGNGYQFGSYTYLAGSGTGPKYGSYISIEQTAGGDHYGLYVSVPQETGYAAYFDGNVKVAKRLKGNDSGNADMKAYIYGSVLANGTVETSNSSDGFSVTKDATGEYTVSFTTSPGDAGVYLVNASLGNNTSFGLIRVERQADSFKVYTANTSGVATDMNFTFVVYKK